MLNFTGIFFFLQGMTVRKKRFFLVCLREALEITFCSDSYYLWVISSPYHNFVLKSPQVFPTMFFFSQGVFRETAVFVWGRECHWSILKLASQRNQRLSWKVLWVCFSDLFTKRIIIGFALCLRDFNRWHASISSGWMVTPSFWPTFFYDFKCIFSIGVR